MYYTEQGSNCWYIMKPDKTMVAAVECKLAAELIIAELNKSVELL